MVPFYVDLREHGPRDNILQVRHCGIVRALDKFEAARKAQERFKNAIETSAQFLVVTRMEKPS